MEDAISQLQVLGVTRGQAKKALARYNNDVARAADYIFSGNSISDDEAEENTVESDEALALRLSAEEEQMQQSFHSTSNNPFNETSPAVTDQQIEPDLPAKIIQQNAEIVPPPVHDTSKWSVVSYKSQENVDISVPPQSSHITMSTQISKENSLTWWKDPEDPSERVALDDLPIGLRPPSYNFAYSPVILQALYHVTAFRHAVLSFRPVPYAWGSPKNYWKGYGEPVPGYLRRQVVSKRQVLRDSEAYTISPQPPPPPPPSASLSQTVEQGIERVQEDGDLISFDSPSNTPSVQEEQVEVEVEEKELVASDSSSASNINENFPEEDLPPLIVESTAPTREQTVEFVDHIDNELQLMPKCLQTLAEMQKIFAFLGSTRRLYGSVSHYVRALNTKLASNGWEFSDKTFEAFLDMMINCLVEADEQSDSAMDPTFIPIFRSLFLIKARIEYGDDYDDEEVYYLTLSTDKNMCSFHDCLDPLVFESYQTAVDEEADPTLSDDEEEEQASYKFTTFKQTPPILMAMLDNRSAVPQKKAHQKYIIDKTIYMDRYMMDKKDKALEGFKRMDTCRREILTSRAEMEKLKNDNTLSMDKRDLLIHTLNYFEQRKEDNEVGEEEIDEGSLELLKSVLGSVKEKIDSRLEDLENVILEQKEKMHHIFDTEDMKDNAYELRASFHHDGKSGTGHYWAYIYIEPSQDSLFEDIPSEGGWYKFCDAYVTAATESEIYNDPVPPFALMYVSADLPKFTKEQLYECLPVELRDCMTADNNLLDQEIHAHNHLQDTGTNGSLISTGSEDDDDDEKTDSQIDSAFADLDLSSGIFDDDTSVGTAVGGQNIETSDQQQHYSFTGQAFSKLKDRVNSKILQVSNYPNDDYRLLKSFETFLARTQNQLLLEHLYLLYSSDKVTDGVETESIIVDEEGSKQDDDLKIIWHEYESYLDIGEMVTQALSYFVKKDFSSALQSLLDSKRHEASWKTQVMLDMDVSNAFSGLATISFNNIVEIYGKACLKILNDNAYTKASHKSYRTRGLEDAMRIAYQAQTVIGPDKLQKDQVYSSLGEKWLTFTEQSNVTLTQCQAELLNTLVMTYLEGQSSGAISNVHSRSESPAQLSDDEDDNEGVSDIPLWQKYQQVCSESKHILAALFSR